MARKRATPSQAPATPTPSPPPSSRSRSKTRAASATTTGASPPAAPPTAAGGPTALRTEARSRFTLYNLLGKERAYYRVDRIDIPKPAEPVSEKSVAHGLVIIDRSGSMTFYIEDLKDTLIKLLTLDEYSQWDMIVTLLSYSGEGDLNVHFQRTPIQEVMKRDSKYLEEIRGIHTAGLTCISQALRLASSLVRPDEMTAITLHSDGYANDPSASAEARALDALVEEMHERPLFVNTIAYSEYSDFKLLSKVANGLSGTCVRAGNMKEVYDALYSTSKLIAGEITPPIEEPLSPEYDYQVFVSHAAGKVNGAAGPLFIRGLKPDHDARVYKFRKITAEEYRALRDVPEIQTGEAVLAFARAQLAEGNLNTAKYAMASTFDATLVERHGRALTNLQVGDMAVDLDLLLFQPALLREHEVLDRVPFNPRISILTLARLLQGHRDGFLVNLKHLQENYIRRGLRRVPGKRDEQGRLIEPWLKTEFVDTDPYVRVQSFDINHNTANLNILIPRRVRLVKVDDGTPITQVAGIALDNLSTFNNYTLVGDGELNVRTLRIKVLDPKLFDELVAQGALEAVEGGPAGAYDREKEYVLRLDQLPLVPPFEGKPNLDGVFTELAELKALTSVVEASLKEASDTLTPEQVEELRRHYLSKNLYLNFPTTTEYTDLKSALAEGTVDARTSYKIDIGSKTIINLSKLPSANEFLKRMYEVVDAEGRKIDKPSFVEVLDPQVSVRHKTLSSRTKITAVDNFLKPIFDNFLGLADNGEAVRILERVGAKDLAGLVKERCRGKKPERGAYVKALADAQRKLSQHAEAVFEDRVSPLVFYVGSTGTLPDEVEARALTAEQLTAKYPNLALSKDEQEGTFFEVGEAVIAVYATREYFSRGAALSGGANVVPAQA